MAKTIRLDIVTPEKIVYSEEVNMVIARAIDGDIGILPGHVSLITALDVWPLRIIKEEGESKLAVNGGFMEVQPDKITILAPSAETSEDIDIERARAAKVRAENRISEHSVDIDMIRAEHALRRAIMRLKASGKDKDE